jgi:hypothetical protein
VADLQQERDLNGKIYLVIFLFSMFVYFGDKGGLLHRKWLQRDVNGKDVLRDNRHVDGTRLSLSVDVEESNR